MLPRVADPATAAAAAAASDSCWLTAETHPEATSVKDFAALPATGITNHDAFDSSRGNTNRSTPAPSTSGGGTRTAATSARSALVASYGNNSDGRGSVSPRPSSPAQMKKKLQQRQRRRQRRRRRTDADNDLFTSFTLNRDPENSKYLPYDEVVYPKLFNRPRETRRPSPSKEAPAHGGSGRGENANRPLSLAAAAELDSIWVVGFVENARRHQKGQLLRELRDFVRLPGSTVLPGAHAALATINQIEQPTTSNSSVPRSTSGGARGDRRARCGDKESGDDGGDQFDEPSARESSGGKSALTALERLRLRELEKRLSRASQGVSEKDLCHQAGVKAYGAANRKLRKILHGARPPAVGPAIKSQGLEAVFRRAREEFAAAVRIQRVYKHYYRRKQFNKMIQQLHGVVRIQALARGVIARRFVAEWYARRSVMVLAWQTVIRRMLSNIQWRRNLTVEHEAASKLQAVARGRAGRDKAFRVRADLAALCIQCLWRGSVDRARVDRLWLGSLATRIQGLARVMVAKRVVGRMRRIRNAAARSIQRCFRGMVARGAMVRLMWERSMASRLDFLRALAAEEDWERENMEITQRRSRRMRLEERLEEAVAAEAAVHAAVFELEVIGVWHR